MATLIHQTGTREAWVFKHDHHDDTIVIFPSNMVGRWYVIREHGHDSISPILIMTATEIFETYGFQVDAWHKPIKV